MAGDRHEGAEDEVSEVGDVVDSNSAGDNGFSGTSVGDRAGEVVGRRGFSLAAFLLLR